MEERKLKNWEKGIQILFEKAPMLESLIKNPVYYSDAPWAGEVNRHFLKNAGGAAGETFYRIVFKQGSPKNLMTIGSGELSGLKTTSVVQKGRIKAVAGLEPVEVSAATDLLPMLLMMGMFGAIQHRLGYISDICVDIRNRQIIGDHARLEKISEVILDCFESIPEMDQNMMRLNLARIVNTTDECLELVVILREELARESNAKNLPYRTFDGRWVEVNGAEWPNSTYQPAEFMRKMTNHNVFAAYERFVAGKICQIVLSGNYSTSNIERSKQSVIRVLEPIRKVFEGRIEAHKNGAHEYEDLIRQLSQGSDVDIGSFTRYGLEQAHAQQLQTISDIESRLNQLLDIKLESFDFLSRLANLDEIDVYLIDDAIVISEKADKALLMQHKSHTEHGLSTNGEPDGIVVSPH